MVEERVQRRLAAILAADVVGYSRMMNKDEAGTLSRLKSVRDVVFEPKTKQHGGRTFKTTGDGALVEFASAIEAVHQALVSSISTDAPSKRITVTSAEVSQANDMLSGDTVLLEYTQERRRQDLE